MASKEELQTALNSLWEKYGNMLQHLSDALDNVDQLKKRKPTVVTKEIERIVEKEVPGPERIVEHINPVNTKLKEDNKLLKNKIKELEKLKSVEKIIEVPVTEYVDSPPTIVEKAATGDLKQAARLLASSEMNKEDLTEKEIFEMLQKSSEEDVKKKIGFWAQPLPTDAQTSETNKRYTGKK